MSKKFNRPRRKLPVRTGRASSPKKLRIAPLLHGPGTEETRAAHEALTFSPYWDNLRLDGFGPGDELQAMELRRCPQCGSTISRLIPAAIAEARLTEASDLIERSRKALAPTRGRAPRDPNGGSGCQVP